MLSEALAALGRERPSRDAIPSFHSKSLLENTAPSLQEMQLSGEVLPTSAVN